MIRYFVQTGPSQGPTFPRNHRLPRVGDTLLLGDLLINGLLDHSSEPCPRTGPLSAR